MSLGFLPALLSAFIAAVMIWRDPRRLRCAVFSGLAVYFLAIELYLLATRWTVEEWGDSSAVLIVAVAALALIGVLFLAALLIHYGVVLLRREGLSMSHGLSLGLGIAILAYVGVAVWMLLANQFQAFIYLFFVALPLVYFAFILVVFLVYQALYGFFARRKRWWPPAIVVLGSGIIGERMTPLLRARVDLGIERYQQGRESGHPAVLALSGGQGPGEAIPEAEAMLRYCLSVGVPATDLVTEVNSRNTEQNLIYTKDALRQAGDPEPWLVTTSDFHAFRAANLMSKSGLSGTAIGAHTPRYFWSAAILREYAALLRDHWKLNLILAATTALPLVIFAIANLTSVG